ncbi:MAG: trigger factor [Prevotella sp.]|nr:trigger factor [Prevotella sp.]
MNIQFECADKINGLMTISIDKADYQEAVDKRLKEFRKKASMPGFRPGMVPMGLIKKQYGTAVKVEEVNRLLSDKLNGYIRDNKIHMLGEPMPNEERQKPQDLQGDGPLEFVFDIAVAPEFDATLTDKDTIEYYEIKADDKAIDEQVRMIAAQHGEMVEAQEWSGNDTLTGDLRQLDADGNTLEDGITTEGGIIMPSYIKGEDEKKKFDGAKPGDIIVFNPRKAYPDNDAELAGLLKMDKEKAKDVDSDFSFQVTAIRHFEPAAVDAKLFEKVFGEGVKDEADFRQRIAKGMEQQMAANSDFKFLTDVRNYLEPRVGDMPEALLRRIMLHNNKEKENAQELVDKNFAEAIKDLKWQLVRDQLAVKAGVKIEDADLKAIAREDVRRQFASYGMGEVPDDLLDQYAEKQLKEENAVNNYVEHAVNTKLIPALKEMVKLKKKKVTLDEFRKLMEA